MIIYHPNNIYDEIIICHGCTINRKTALNKFLSGQILILSPISHFSYIEKGRKPQNMWHSISIWKQLQSLINKA